MPNEQNHLDQAESNKKVAKEIEQTFPDWSVTICFYTALHWIEGYAKRQGVDIKNEYDGRSLHERREKYVADVAKQLSSRTLRNAYEDLETESKKARYLEQLDTSAKEHYTKSRHKVNGAFQKLQIVKQVLGL
jgi:hypothetical protein